jgi:hypothetical protein
VRETLLINLWSIPDLLGWRLYESHLLLYSLGKISYLGAPQYVASLHVRLDLHRDCSFPGIFLARSVLPALLGPSETSLNLSCPTARCRLSCSS